MANCIIWGESLFGFQGIEDFKKWLSIDGASFKQAHAGATDEDLFKKVGDEDLHGAKKVKKEKFQSYCQMNTDKCEGKIDSFVVSLFGFQGGTDFSDWCKNSPE